MLETNRIENQNILGSQPSPPLSLEYRVIYEVMWKNMVETDRPQMT